MANDPYHFRGGPWDGQPIQMDPDLGEYTHEVGGAFHCRSDISPIVTLGWYVVAADFSADFQAERPVWVDDAPRFISRADPDEPHGGGSGILPAWREAMR